MDIEGNIIGTDSTSMDTAHMVEENITLNEDRHIPYEVEYCGDALDNDEAQISDDTEMTSPYEDIQNYGEYREIEQGNFCKHMLQERYAPSLFRGSFHWLTSKYSPSPI